MNQRQKKKASQGKKRYHEAAKKHSKTPPHTQEQTKSSMKTPAVDEHSRSTKYTKSGDDGQAVDSKSFSKRKVTSNWSRYDEGDSLDSPGGYLRTSETEEELQQRLVQLFNLPTQVPANQRTVEYTLPDNKENPHFITLDCEALAKSLANLPAHERLGISAELLELGRHSHLTSSADDDLSSMKALPPPVTSEGKQDTINMTGTSKNDKQQELATHFNFQQCAHTVPDLRSTPQKEVECDSELDQLLLQQAPAVSDKASMTKSEDKTPTGVVTQETDELDDMLDELLA